MKTTFVLRSTFLCWMLFFVTFYGEKVVLSENNIITKQDIHFSVTQFICCTRWF